MTRPLLTRTMCLLFCLAGGPPFIASAATTFNGSTIVNIDRDQRTITFRSQEGESWTLPVADPNMFQTHTLAKGDRVSIEINLDDKITKVLRSSGPPPSQQSGMRDDMSQ